MSHTTGGSTLPISELFQFIYISRITSIGLAGASTLNDIAETSIKNNAENGITGILCYGNGCFFQCVEGSEQALTNLKNQLLVDERHKDLTTLDFSKIAARRFSDWSMKSLVLERLLYKDPTIKSLMPFKPYSWVGTEWQDFTNALHRYYERQTQQNAADPQPVKYNALGVSLNKIVGQHQAFFLIQTILGALIVLALLWFVFSSGF